MKNIRIGKDIALKWTVTVDGVSRDLSELDLHLFLHNETAGSAVELAFTTQTDVLRTEVLGRDQRNTGVYRLTLWLNKDQAGQSVLDESTAFRLVARTEMEGGLDDNNLETEVVELSGNLTTDGYRDYSELSERVEALEEEVPKMATKEELYDYALNGTHYQEDKVFVQQVNGEYAQISAATSENAGVMSAAQVQALEESELLYDSQIGSDYVAVVMKNGSSARIPDSVLKEHAGVGQVEGALQSEVTRATAAESSLQLAIAAETSRATNAEAALQTKVSLVEEASAVATLAPAVDTYTRLNAAVGTLEVTLPAINASTNTHAVSLMIYMETGASPAVTFVSADNRPIVYYDGFALDANAKYEVSALFNGVKWVLANGTIA